MSHEEFKNALMESGVCEETVDVGSAMGRVRDQSKCKSYYRSRRYSDLGVLVIDDVDMPLQRAMEQLTNELSNYGRLKQVGFDVPVVTCQPFQTENHLSGRSATAMVVEHIPGLGPHKGTTELGAIVRKVQSCLVPDAQEIARQSWDKIRLAAATRCPMDLQILIQDTGRLVVIDPEAVGGPRELGQWPVR